MTDLEPMMTQWVVYDHPKDYPNCYVARRWEITKDGPVATATFLATPDIEAIRDFLLAQGLVKLLRQEEDEPQIMEVWL